MGEATIYGAARDVTMLVITALVWWWGRDRKMTQELIERRFVTLDGQHARMQADITGLYARLQEVIGRIDRLPGDMADRFVTVDRVKDVWEQSRHEHDKMWDDIKRLRDKP